MAKKDFINKETLTQWQNELKLIGNNLIELSEKDFGDRHDQFNCLLGGAKYRLQKILEQAENLRINYSAWPED